MSDSMPDSTTEKPTAERNDFELLHFLRAYHAAHLAANTLGDYEMQLRHFSRYFALWLAKQESQPRPPRLSDLSVLHLQGAMNWQLERGRAKPTADKLRRAVLAVWYKAVHLREDLHLSVADPPAKGTLKKLSSPKRKPLAWSIAEFERILFAASQLEDRIGSFRLAVWFPALLWLVYNSGLRISAAMATTWQNVDFGQRRMVVEAEDQKDDEGQNVILLPETVEAMRPLRGFGKLGVFDHWPHDRGVEQWPALTLVLKKCLVSAGLATSVKDVSRRDLWHKIRRTFATAIYAQSGDIEQVREFLGHSDISTTWLYIDKTKIGRKSQADLLPTPQPARLRIFNRDAGAG